MNRNKYDFFFEYGLSRNIECLRPLTKNIFLTQSKNIDAIDWNAIEMVGIEEAF